MIRILCLIGGYIFGLFQTGYVYGKITGISFYDKGSGNAGATNALRVAGVRAGILVFIGDALKAFIPCFLVKMLLPGTDSERYIYLIYTALGVTLGNDFPFYLKGRGGKGVAAISGIYLSINPILWILGMAFFFGMAFLTGYVSLASMVTTALVLIMMVLFHGKFFPGALFSGNTWEFYLILLIITALLWIRHKENIRRLLNGTENRFGHKKK